MGVMTTQFKKPNNCHHLKDDLFVEEVIRDICNNKGYGLIVPDIVIPTVNYVQVLLELEERTDVFNSLDIVFIQDISGSFEDDLSVVNNLLDDLLNAITSKVPDTQFGITTFSDVPREPYGETGDHAFSLVQPLTSNKDTFKNSYASIQLLNGNDAPESQLIALRQTALASLGYRSNSKKVFILLTDAGYHTNDEDPAYPTEASLVTTLNELGAYVVYGLSDTSVQSDYTNLLNNLGGSVGIIGSSSESLIQAVDEGLAAGQTSLAIPVKGTVVNGKPNSAISITAVDSTGTTRSLNTTLDGFSQFVTGTTFNGLADGNVSFTFVGVDNDNAEFTLIKSVYKY